MAKRFTDNEKWKKVFFKSLSTVDKLFFLYILDDCDHAGIWHVELDIAEMRIGEKVDVDNFKKQLGKHLIEFDNGEKWFIPTFVEFQYGELNPSVNAHKSVINKLKKYNLIKQLNNPSVGVKDKDKDKDKDLDMDKVYSDILETWNFFAGEYNLSKIIKLSNNRKTHIKVRLKDKDFDLISILKKSEQQPFLLGVNDKGWKMSFDWLFESENNYIKVLENKYEGSNEKSGTGVTKSEAREFLKSVANDTRLE